MEVVKALLQVNFYQMKIEDIKKFQVYLLVVKTTKNRKENFVKSFHIIKLEQY